MSKVVLFYEKLMINILGKNGNIWQYRGGEISKQQQIKQSVLA